MENDDLRKQPGCVGSEAAIQSSAIAHWSQEAGAEKLLGLRYQPESSDL